MGPNARLETLLKAQTIDELQEDGKKMLSALQKAVEKGYKEHVKQLFQHYAYDREELNIAFCRSSPTCRKAVSELLWKLGESKAVDEVWNTRKINERLAYIRRCDHAIFTAHL